MFRRLLLLAAFLVFAQCTFTSSASAQLPIACYQITIWYFPDPLPIAYFVYSPNGQGPYSYYIAAMKAICPPIAAAKETCPTCPHAQNPISLATGNTYIEESDFAIPGLGGGLSLRRTWNSTWPDTQTTHQVGLFGTNWTTNIEEKIFIGSDHYVKYMRGNGSFWSFGLNGTAWSIAAPANESATLVPGSTSWTLTFKNGEKKIFDINTGLLTAIVDRNGNTTQLTYDSSNRLVTVTDAAGRHLYFSYANSSSYLVTGITSDIGLTMSYAYDAQGRLAQVTKPDLTTLNYTYNSQSLITSVTDSQGKVIESHTYDSQRRGVTASQANGVNAVTVNYPN